VNDRPALILSAPPHGQQSLDRLEVTCFGSRINAMVTVQVVIAALLGVPPINVPHGSLKLTFLVYEVVHVAIVAPVDRELVRVHASHLTYQLPMDSNGSQVVRWQKIKGCRRTFLMCSPLPNSRNQSRPLLA
jgi:hypothetical protein